MPQLHLKTNWSGTRCKFTKSLLIHAKCIVPQFISLPHLPYSILSTPSKWSLSVMIHLSPDKVKLILPSQTNYTKMIPYSHTFCLPYWDTRLRGYCLEENSFTCDLVPGVIGTLKLFKSQMKISESLAPEARRLLYRKKKVIWISCLWGKRTDFLRISISKKTQDFHSQIRVVFNRYL